MVPWHQNVLAFNLPKEKSYSFVTGILWACGFIFQRLSMQKKNPNLRKTLISQRMSQTVNKHDLVLHTLGLGFIPEDETDWSGLQSKAPGLESEAQGNVVL